MSNNQKRISGVITGNFTAQEVIALVSQIMVGNSYVYGKDELRRFYGKVAVEFAEIVEPDDIPSAHEQDAWIDELASAGSMIVHEHP